MKQKKHLNGFALIELFVIVAVLVVLATLFFLPALHRARQHSQDVGCLNNLRQLTIGWQMYNADNKSIFPNNGDQGDQPSSLSSPNDPQWCPGEMQTEAPVPGEQTNTLWIKKGLIYPYVGSLRFYRCPADTSTARGSIIYPLGGPGNPRIRSVAMNAWIAPFPAGIGDIGVEADYYRVYRKDADMAIPGPGKLLLFIDENPYTISDTFFWEEPTGNASPPTATEWIDVPAVFHNGSGGISFCDGHIQMRKWTDPAVINAKSSGVNATPPRTDLLWLLQRTTAQK